MAALDPNHLALDVRTQQPEQNSAVGCRLEERQVSMMEDVRGLMEWVRSTAVASEGERLSPLTDRENAWPAAPPNTRRTPLASTPCPSEQAAVSAIIAPVFSKGLDAREGVEPYCQFTFRRWVLCTIVMCVLMASASMFVALDRSTNLIRSEAIEHCERAMNVQKDYVDVLVDKNVTAASFKATLRSMSVMVEELVKKPAARGVAAVWGSMRASKHLNASWDGRTPKNRDSLAYRTWVEMSRQWDLTEGTWSSVNPRHAQEQNAKKASDALSVLYLSGEVAGCEVRRREFSCPAAGAALCTGGCIGWCTRLSVSKLDAPGSINGSTVLTHEDVEHGLWDRRHMASQETHNPLSVPSLNVQARQAAWAAASPGGAGAVPAEPLWSEVYMSERSLKLSFAWTAPIAPCGNYSCLEGAVAAEVSLPRVSVDCAMAWNNLSELLASPEYDFPIGTANSSLFVVHVDGASESESILGQLVGTSDTFPITRRVKAEFASQDVVQATARAVLAKFGAWNATELLHSEQLFTFRRSSALRGRFEECLPELHVPIGPNPQNIECWQVGTLVVELDKRTSWLLVASLPAGAFNRKAVQTAAVVMDRVQTLRNSSHSSVNQARMTGVGITFFIAAIGISLGFGLGCAVSEPLQRLGHLMHLLSDLDWGRHSAELSSLRAENQRAHIQDISELQNAFCSLVLGVQAFAKFVPGTVVTRVIRGDRRATRLHVDRRDVTVMFSSIGNFKAVSKELTDEGLLKVIGRYHTVMTRVAEHYEGAVTEILDDGLLVYFNTPDDVTHHAAKACEAALAQQKATELLNQELAEDGLPTLAIQIGIHTGNVLSGNIGTDRKMKFGCMGDSVNLASRLNGCCKFYGVSVICSGATFLELPKGIGLFCRKLDLVRVKGRREPTPIYEIVGREQRSETWTSLSASVRSASSMTSPGTIRKSFSEQVARVCSRSPAAVTSAAGFYAPGVRCLTPQGRSPNPRSRTTNPFHLSPMADAATPLEGIPSPFFAPSMLEGGAGTARTGSKPQPSQGDTSHVNSGIGEDECGYEGESGSHNRMGTRTLSGRLTKGSLRLPCLNSRGSLPLPKQGRRRSLGLPGLPGDNLPCDPSPGPDMFGRAASTSTGETGMIHHVSSLGGASPDDCCVTPEQRTHARRYEEALEMFQQARFTEACDAARALVEEHPGDVPTQMLYKRASLHVALDGAASGGLSEDQLRSWTGETRMDEK